MVSWVSTTIAIIVMASCAFSFPVFEEHGEIAIPETIGHEQVFDGHLGISHDLHLEPKHATSYQEFNLESKNPVPVIIKTKHEIPIHHFSSIGSHEGFGSHISEIEPLKLHHEI